MEQTKCLIIGSGPAGYTAAIYASRANLQPILYSGLQPGGQLTQTTEIENFPGFPNPINGSQLMDNLRQQAQHFGANIRNGEITQVDFTAPPYHLKDDSGNHILAHTVIIATGATANYLGLPDEQKYIGMGLSACATCDGFFYRNKTVAVVGGGDTACEDALYLSSLCKKVYIIVRKPLLRASHVMQQRVIQRENIEILFQCNTLSLYGQPTLQGARLVKQQGTYNQQIIDIAIDGLFLAIGHTPATHIFKPWLDTDQNGYLLKLNGTPRTKLPGIFVAGDCADPNYRQAITAAATGCQAALEAERYLMK